MKYSLLGSVTLTSLDGTSWFQIGPMISLSIDTSDVPHISIVVPDFEQVIQEDWLEDDE